jgi:aldehyde dehydrogenase (NAD+)
MATAETTGEAPTLRYDELYVDGAWVAPERVGEAIRVEDAVTGGTLGTVPVASEADADRAVRAAVRALPSWSTTPLSERTSLLRRLADELEHRADELAPLMTREVGTPLAISRRVQVGLPVAILRAMAEDAEDALRPERLGTSLVLRQPVGVVAAITPWNYPLYQLMAKMAPALVAGNTLVVKPSSVAPLSTYLLAEIVASLDLPPGVCNVITGRGAVIGEALATHPMVDMVSLTGSTAAGARVAELAAPMIKRVALELGGKSAFLVTAGADLDAAIPAAVRMCFVNNGQTCAATTRLLVPDQDLAEVEERLVELVGGMTVGDPFEEGTDIGPLASSRQQASVAGYLAQAHGAGTVIVGGPGEVPGVGGGFYVRPTVVSRVDRSSALAREEIFGPVLAVMGTRDTDDAVATANASEYGLSGAVWAPTVDEGIEVASRLRTGQVAVNGGRFNARAPFGGFKQSGVGRELGPHGLAEYVELSSLQLPNEA